MALSNVVLTSYFVGDIGPQDRYFVADNVAFEPKITGDTNAVLAAVVAYESFALTTTTTASAMVNPT